MVTTIDRKRKELVERYSNDLVGMPKLKGTNPKAKNKILNQIDKVKKPSRQELNHRSQAWAQRLADDERASEMTEQVHAN